MNTFITRDGAELYYKDWGDGAPVLFSHGWPLNADMWEYQMGFLAAQGYRCIALDRRGFGRSSQPWDGYDFDSFADDLAAFMQSLDLIDTVAVGFSMGACEIARYVGRHGTGRIAKLVLMSAPLPGPLVPAGGTGSQRAYFDAALAGLTASRQQFCAQFTAHAFGLDRPGAAVPDGAREWAFGLAMQASPKATQDGVTALSETDFRSDLAAIDVPTLILHGDDDQVIPFASTAPVAASLIPQARLSRYAQAPHWLWLTHRDRVNAELLAFLQAPP